MKRQKSNCHCQIAYLQFGRPQISVIIRQNGAHQGFFCSARIYSMMQFTMYKKVLLIVYDEVANTLESCGVCIKCLFPLQYT